MENNRIIDLGCGLNKYNGALGLDFSRGTNADVIADMDGYNLPFKSDSFNRIICSDILEHIRNVENVMMEIHRIAKSNAIVKIRVPYFSSVHSYDGLSHKHFFTTNTFELLTSRIFGYSIIKNEISFWKIKGKYDIVKWVGLSYLFNRFRRFYEKFLPFIFTAQCLKVELKIIK